MKYYSTSENKNKSLETTYKFLKDFEWRKKSGIFYLIILKFFKYF